MTGRVYLVGAGCGGPELLTLRGAQLLGQCDCVVYDDLIGDELLSLAPADCQRIYMGKRAGRHSARQEEISAALIALAQSGKRVVRLKGGDPFVFGRGGEELLALRAAGVPCEAVPGVSSAIAIPAGAGIPVTHRGLSQSLHIITAHTAAGDGLPPGLDRLARLPGTLVFLMGLSRLEQLAGGLISAGMPGDTPAAVISGGNAPCPAAVRGRLDGLARQVRQAGVQAPAVIVVGAVAALDLSSAIGRPLSGVRVGLTGTPALTRRLGRALEEQGARSFLALPARAEELPLDFDLKTLCAGRHWVVLTSANGVEIFFRRLSQAGIDLRSLGGCRFGVIGAATAARLWEHGIQADLCPERYTSRDLAQALLRAGDPEREDVLLFRSRLGAPELYQLLARRFAVTEIPLYNLRFPTQAAERTRSALEGAGYLVFASASAADRFLEVYGAVPGQAVCVCIGEVTARPLRRLDRSRLLIAPETSAQGILTAILNHAASQRPPG